MQTAYSPEYISMYDEWHEIKGYWSQHCSSFVGIHMGNHIKIRPTRCAGRNIVRFCRQCKKNQTPPTTESEVLLYKLLCFPFQILNNNYGIQKFDLCVINILLLFQFSDLSPLIIKKKILAFVNLLLHMPTKSFITR